MSWLGMMIDIWYAHKMECAIKRSCSQHQLEQQVCKHP